MWTLKYAICGEVLKLNKGFLSSDYAACCLVSMMMLCRNIKRTRLNREDCRDKFYIFNTYFFETLEEALLEVVYSFVSCSHSSLSKWLALCLCTKNGMIIVFWLRNTRVPWNRSFVLCYGPGPAGPGASGASAPTGAADHVPAAAARKWLGGPRSIFLRGQVYFHKLQHL